MLVGKALYLRGGYLDNSLSFDEHGRIIGTLSAGLLHAQRHPDRTMCA